MFQHPTEEERLYQDGTKVMLNEKIAATAHKLYDVSQDDLLNNDFVKPYSAYNFFSRASFLRNPYVIRVLQILLDRPGAHLNSEYEENVRIHENSKFLYRSDQATAAMRNRLTDYGYLTLGLLTVTGACYHSFIPLVLWSLFVVTVAALSLVAECTPLFARAGQAMDDYEPPRAARRLAAAHRAGGLY